MLNPKVIDGLGGSLHGAPIIRREHACPDHAHANVRVRIVLQNHLLHRTGTLQAGRSGRRYHSKQAQFGFMVVKVRFQWCGSSTFSRGRRCRRGFLSALRLRALGKRGYNARFESESGFSTLITVKCSPTSGASELANESTFFISHKSGLERFWNGDSAHLEKG